VFPITPENTSFVISVGAGLVVGLTAALVWVLLQAMAAQRITGYRATIPLGALFGFTVVVLVTLFASPLRPQFVWLVIAAVGAAVIGVGASRISAAALARRSQESELRRGTAFG
jgi:hypothetical protein